MVAAHRRNHKNSRYMRLSVAFCCFFVAVLGLSPEASASAQSTSATTGPLSHCEQRLGANGVGNEPMRCFATLGEATAVALNNSRYRDMSDQTVMRALLALSKRPYSAATSSEASPDASYIIGIDYENTHYNGGSTSGGATYEWDSGSTCTSSRYFYQPSMPSGWNDRVSSAANYPYSGCGRWTHYQNGSYGGATINCGYNSDGGAGDGCYNMETFASNGNMNDKTSSEKWTNT